MPVTQTAERSACVLALLTHVMSGWAVLEL